MYEYVVYTEVINKLNTHEDTTRPKEWKVSTYEISSLLPQSLLGSGVHSVVQQSFLGSLDNFAYNLICIICEFYKDSVIFATRFFTPCFFPRTSHVC